MGGYFASLSEFVEYLFIIGLQKEALELAELSNNHALAHRLVNSYTIKSAEVHSELEKLQVEKIKKRDYCLLSQEEYEFLYLSASTLEPNSKILEIGTYLGGSTSALSEGSSNNRCEITTIDVYQGFGQKNSNSNLGQALNWDYNYWQCNTRIYSNRIRSIRGSATNILRKLAREGERFDLIFLDAAHSVETYFELSLISCVASNNCILVVDDVVDWGSNKMTSAWALGLKNFLCYPRFFKKFAIANFKDDSTPFNFKYEISEESVATFKKVVQEVVATKNLETISF